MKQLESPINKQLIGQPWALYSLSIFGDFITNFLITGTILYGSAILRYSSVEIGWIGSAFGWSYFMMPALLGHFGDKYSRKGALILATLIQFLILVGFLVGFIIISGNSIGISMASNNRKDLLLFILMSMGLLGIPFGIYWPTIEAALSDSGEGDSKKHKKIMANFCVAWSFGNAMGPITAGWLIEKSFIYVLWLSVIIAAISILIVFIGFSNRNTQDNGKYTKKKRVREKVILSEKNKSENEKIEIENKNKRIEDENNGIRNNEKSELFKVNNQKLEHLENKRKIRIAYLISLSAALIYAIVCKITLAYFPNYATIPDGLNWSPVLTGNVLFWYGIGRFSYFIIGRYSHNSHNQILIAMIIVGILVFGLIFIQNSWLISLIMFLLGFTIGRVYLMAIELLLQANEEGKGTHAGRYESMIGVGATITPLFMGFLATYTLTMPFIILSLTIIMVAIIEGITWFFSNRK